MELESKEEARKLNERLEVRYNPHPFRTSVVLTPSQGEEWQKELKRKQEEVAGEEPDVCCDPYPPAPTERHSDSPTGEKETKGSRTRTGDSGT